MIIDNIVDAFRFKDTVFYKDNSDLQDRYNALKLLVKEYPNNDKLLNEMFIIKKGLEGENEIAYQLKKANIGMYILRDVKIKYKDMTAQIDYVIITPVFIYYVECKNLIGNITVNDKGDFIREFTVNGKKIKKGMYSPLRQVEAQREVVRKLWEDSTSNFIRVFASSKFNYYRKVLVVVANQDTILNTSKAPKDIKYKVLRADALVNQIKYDINHINRDEYFNSKTNMEKIAKGYLSYCVEENINYYEYYKNKYCNIDDLKERLIELRKRRSSELNIPLYYVFNNEELEKLIELQPKSLDELRNLNILSSIKIKCHGEALIDEINKIYNK